MNLTNVPYRIQPLARVVAYKLYVYHANDNPGDQLSLEQIGKLFSVPISRNLIVSSLDFLRNWKWVARTSNSSKSYRYKMTQGGLTAVEEFLDDKNSDIWYFGQHGDSALDDVAGPGRIFLTDRERINGDAWAPLPIDRQNSAYQEALTAAEDALRKIRSDNGYAAHHSSEREGIVATLEEGVSALRDHAPSKQNILRKLIEPLQYIAGKFVEGALHEVAIGAAKKILTWLAGFW